MKLRKAIKTIKKECKKHSLCATCPLRQDEHYCAIQVTSPDTYKLKNKKAWDKDDPAKRIFA